jgi:hypothetical protein
MTKASETFLDDARRAFAATDALFRAELVAECHPFKLRALRSCLAAWGDEETAFAALSSTNYPDLARLRAALAVTPEMIPNDFDWIWAEAERLYRFSVPRLAPERTRTLRRRVAIALAASTVLVVTLVAARLWGGWRVTASATYSPDFAASQAIDGNDATEWLPPDGQSGWLEIDLPRARHVHAVRIYNGHNRFYVDRGTHEFKVTLFAGERELKSQTGHFDQMTDQVSKIDVPFDVDGVTRVRVDATSFFGKGVAIGDIELR